MVRDVKKWENQSDSQRLEQLHNDLAEALLAIKNLTHEVGRLAARQTTTEVSLKSVAAQVEKIELDPVKT